MKLKKCDLRAAYLAAHTAETGQMPDRHGAVVFHGRKILSRGINKNKTHPLATQYYEYPFIHAEFDSVLKAKQDVSGCSVAVVRINNRGELLNSKPCSHCFRFLKEKNIKYIVYSSKNGLTKIRV